MMEGIIAFNIQSIVKQYFFLPQLSSLAWTHIQPLPQLSPAPSLFACFLAPGISRVAVSCVVFKENKN